MQNHSYWYHLALSAYSAENYPEAYLAFKQAATISPSVPVLLLGCKIALNHLPFTLEAVKHAQGQVVVLALMDPPTRPLATVQAISPIAMLAIQ